MAFLECHFHSDVLGMACTMNVIVPQVANTQIGMAAAKTVRKDYPVLYLLHGLSDDETIWMRRTSIERYASEYQVVVVMPNVHRSFYTDMEDGCGNYWSFISEELPQIVANLFPVSSRREDTFAAGLSMGGYGALKLALRCPERYAGAVALSPVADIREWIEKFGEAKESRRIFGRIEDLASRGNDLLALAEKACKAAQVPRILHVIGTEDFLYSGNQNLRQCFEKLNFPGYSYIETSGVHCWEFWDTWIQKGLNFLLNK